MTTDSAKRDDHWEMLEKLALFGSAVFLEQLIPIEKAKTEYVRFSESNSRNYLLLRILIEVQKAGFAMWGWRQSPIASLQTMPAQELNAMDQLSMESMVDTQSLFQRKLTEGLVLLINFSTTNDPAYYYHFLLIGELRRCDTDLKEQKRFFSGENRATLRRQSRILTKIMDVERSLPNKNNCWYVNDMTNQKREIASFSKQLERALPLANAWERQALCFTYSKGFGEYSGNIHLSPLKPDYTKPSQRIAFGFVSCGILSILIIQRAHGLSGVQPAGINKHLEKALQTPAAATMPKVLNVGDFVLVDGPCLAVIEEIVKSSHGYYSYRVTYLGDRPEPNIHEDWFSQFDVSLFQSRTNQRQALEDQLAEYQRRGMSAMEPPVPDEEKEEAIRQAMQEVWERGLGTYIKREAIPRLQDHGDTSLDP